MRQPPSRSSRTAAALPVYLIVMVGLQVFLVTVSVEAFSTDSSSLAWSTAAVSVCLAALGALFLRNLDR